MKKIIIIFLLLNCVFLSSYGQKARKIRAKFGYSPESLMNIATEFYNEGNYDACISVLDSVWQHHSDYTKKNIEEILVLKKKALIEKDDLEKADASAYSVYKNNPNYELILEDHEEDYNRLMNKFDVHSLLSFGIKNAALFPKYKTTKVYSISDNIDYNSAYIGGVEVLYGLNLEYEFLRNISFNVEFSKYNLNFKRTLKGKNSYQLDFSEKMNFYQIPLGMKAYLISNKSISIYGSFGANMNILSKSIANITNVYETEDIYSSVITNHTKNTDGINVTPMRNKYTYDCFVGIGFGYKINKLRIGLDARYCFGLSSITKAEARFRNEEFTNNYFYIDNSVLVNKFELGINISYSFMYSIKKNR